MQLTTVFEAEDLEDVVQPVISASSMMQDSDVLEESNSDYAASSDEEEDAQAAGDSSKKLCDYLLDSDQWKINRHAEGVLKSSFEATLIMETTDKVILNQEIPTILALVDELDDDVVQVPKTTSGVCN